MPLMMVSMVMSAYSSAAGSALPAALPQPSTTALPPAGGAQGALATGAASGDPRNARKGGTFANVFSEIKQFLQDGVSLLGNLHVLINLRRKTIAAMSECSQSRGHSCSHMGGAAGLCGGHPPETNAPIPNAGWGQKGGTVTCSRVRQPQSGMGFSIMGQLEETRTLEIHVKLTRVEAAWENLGGMYGAGEARSHPGSQPEVQREVQRPCCLAGWGALCPPCPQGFAASPDHLAVGRSPTLPACLGLCPLPQEPPAPIHLFRST